MALFGVKTVSLLACVAMCATLAVGCGSSDHTRYTVAGRCGPTDPGCSVTSDRWWRRYRGAVRRGQGSAATGGSCPGGGFTQSCTDLRLVDGPVRSGYGGYAGSRMGTRPAVTVGGSRGADFY